MASHLAVVECGDLGLKSSWLLVLPYTLLLELEDVRERVYPSSMLLARLYVMTQAVYAR